MFILYVLVLWLRNRHTVPYAIWQLCSWLQILLVCVLKEIRMGCLAGVQISLRLPQHREIRNNLILEWSVLSYGLVHASALQHVKGARMAPTIPFQLDSLPPAKVKHGWYHQPCWLNEAYDALSSSPVHALCSQWETLDHKRFPFHGGPQWLHSAKRAGALRGDSQKYSTTLYCM